MKLGVSTYSLYQALEKEEMNLLEIIEWVKEVGGEHVEIVPLGFTLLDDPQLVEEVIAKAKEAYIEISNYAVSGDFINKNEDELQEEIVLLKKQVDIAHKLGVRYMRHDVAFRPSDESSIYQFEQDLAQIVRGSQAIADYASQFGITTSIENHGYFVQSSDRVQRVIHEVNRPNFKTTLDIGNFLCVDEQPFAAVKKNLPYASVIHVKDFYVREESYNPGQGWFKSTSGKYLRGAIAGHGDMDIYALLKEIKRANYAGYITIEFEGLEDCKLGTKIGLDNVRRIWEEV